MEFCKGAKDCKVPHLQLVRRAGKLKLHRTWSKDSRQKGRRKDEEKGHRKKESSSKKNEKRELAEGKLREQLNETAQDLWGEAS